MGNSDHLERLKHWPWNGEKRESSSQIHIMQQFGGKDKHINWKLIYNFQCSSDAYIKMVLLLQDSLLFPSANSLENAPGDWRKMGDNRGDVHYKGRLSHILYRMGKKGELQNHHLHCWNGSRVQIWYGRETLKHSNKSHMWIWSWIQIHPHSQSSLG